MKINTKTIFWVIGFVFLIAFASASFGYGDTGDSLKIVNINNYTINGTSAVHNDLTGLQGGDVGEYYHIKQLWYNELLTDIFDWITQAEGDVRYFLISDWNTNYTTNNLAWLNTTNLTYGAYNSTGLIRDWNSTGLIKDFNASGYIKNWNASGFIANQTPDLSSYLTSETLWNANYSTFLTHRPWSDSLNGTLMSQATYNTNYTNFRPLINLSWWETNYTANDAAWRVDTTGISWANAVNGTLFTTDLYNTNYTTNNDKWLNTTNLSYVPYIGAISNVDLGIYNLATLGNLSAHSLNLSGDLIVGPGADAFGPGVGGYIAVGIGAQAGGGDSIALGTNTDAGGGNSVAMGYGTVTDGNSATAMGYHTYAGGQSSTSMGYYTNATGDYSTAIGSLINVSGDYSVGIGLNSTSYNIPDNNVFSIMGGKVGIGLGNPQNILNVMGDINATTSVFSQNKNLSIGYDYTTNGTLYLSTNPFGFYNSTTAPIYLNDTFVGNYSDYLNTKNYALNDSRWSLNYSAFLLSYAYATNDSFLLNSGDTATGNYTFDSGTLFIDSVSDRVGIGTSSPSNKLTVQSSGHSTSPLMVLNNDGNDRAWIFQDSDGDYGLVMRDKSANNNVMIRAADTSYFLGGNVGIGTSSPATKFEVAGTSRITSSTDPQLQFNDSDASARLWILYGESAQDKFHIRDATAPATRLTIDSSGNVGIGTASPSNKLTVAGGNIQIDNNRYYRGKKVDGTEINLLGIGTEGSGWLTAPLNLYISSNSGGAGGYQALTILSTGLVGIGTSAPVTKLHVNGTLTIGTATNPVNITMYSPDGTGYSCGVLNGGAWACV